MRRAPSDLSTGHTGSSSVAHTHRCAGANGSRCFTRKIRPVTSRHSSRRSRGTRLFGPKREEVFGPLGVTNIRTFVNPQNRTQVAVLMDVADLDAVMAAMENPAMGEAMAYDGVLPETLVLLVEE